MVAKTLSFRSICFFEGECLAFHSLRLSNPNTPPLCCVFSQNLAAYVIYSCPGWFGHIKYISQEKFFFFWDNYYVIQSGDWVGGPDRIDRIDRVGSN